MSNKTKAGNQDDAEAMAKTAGTDEMSDNELEGVAGGLRLMPKPMPGRPGVRPLPMPGPVIKPGKPLKPR
jgi:hypothetical protein